MRHRARAAPVRLLGRRASRRSRGRRVREHARAGRDARVRLALALRPPVPRHREVRRQPERPGRVRADRHPRRARPRRAPRRGSARSCSARRCGPRRCSPRRSPRSTASPAAGSTSGSAPAGTSPSTPRSAWRSRRRACACARLREAVDDRRPGCSARGGPVTYDGEFHRPTARAISRPRCSSRARRCSSAARATGCSPRRSSWPTAGTRAGSGRPTTTASGSTCSTRVRRVGRDPGDGLALARALRALRRGRGRPRAALRAAPRADTRRVCSTASRSTSGAGPARRHGRAGPGAGREWGELGRRDDHRRARVPCRSRWRARRRRPAGRGPRGEPGRDHDRRVSWREARYRRGRSPHVRTSVRTELIIILLIVLLSSAAPSSRSSPARWGRPRRSSRRASTRATRTSRTKDDETGLSERPRSASRRHLRRRPGT